MAGEHRLPEVVTRFLSQPLFLYSPYKYILFIPKSENMNNKNNQLIYY
ncbi:hypothetical protein CUZ88_1214 [Enterococcus xinjiangensis]|nr:hypothetical protein [Enterococcus lactis]